MKKFFVIAAVAIMTVMSLSLTSCSDAEEGEDWGTWVMRNQLNSKWSLDYVMVNDEYRRMGEDGFDFFMNLKLTADGRKFSAERFFYDHATGSADESTRVKKSGTYTIDEPNKTVELIDSEGNKFMRLSDISFGTGSMSATILFYDLNQTYVIGLNRGI